MSHDYFGQPRRDWSARKHAVLQAYLPAFCTALSRVSRQQYTGTIWYVDGFAGAGRYDGGAPGSPLLAAEAVRQLPYNVRCLNVEEDDACYASLIRETASYSNVSNIQGDFNVMVDQVLATVEQCPALFFLDSFGMKVLPMVGLIERIATRRLATDILLRYDTEGIRRVVGAYENTHDPRSVAHGQSLDRIFRGQAWRQIIANQPAGRDRDKYLLEHYRQQLSSIPGGRMRFVASYPIRTIEGHVKYHLVFGTGDQLGVKIMSDVLRQAEARYLGDQQEHRRQQLAAQPAVQLGLFEEPTVDIGQQQQQHLEAVGASIVQVGQTVGVEWEYEALFYELLLHQGWFARLSDKDYRAACKALATRGAVRRISEGRAWDRGTRFRITV